MVTVTGEIADGVEPGCVLLKTADRTYLLIGGDLTTLRSGTRVTVVGTPQADLMSTCQQGIPFKVSEVRPG